MDTLYYGLCALKICFSRESLAPFFSPELFVSLYSCVFFTLLVCEGSCILIEFLYENSLLVYDFRLKAGKKQQISIRKTPIVNLRT